MKMLMTGFEPAPGIDRTPSGELAKLWAREVMVDGLDVRSVVVPQVFRACTKLAIAEIISFKPDFVLMYGAVPSNDAVRIERFFLNVEHTQMGDNTRVPVHDRKILQDGPSAYEATLPHDFLLSRLGEADVRSRLSYNAGQHTCNSISMGVLDFLTRSGLDIPCGFIHVPFPLEFAFGIAEDETGLMHWADIRRASAVLASSMVEYVSSR
jgi:pyroglutamyl-peptidase